MNDNKGWIKFHRQIQDHYLFKEKRVFSKFEAWTDILLSCNHTENKIMLGNELIDVNIGQLITSELKLMDRWKWSKSKVRAFLNLLEKDSMIEKTTDKKKTTLTVVKYGDYQVLQTTKEPQKNHKETINRPQKDTYNNVKNDNNVKNEINTNIEDRKLQFAENLKPFLDDYGKDMLNDFYLYWTEPNKSGKKMKFELQTTFEISRRLIRWSSNGFNQKKTPEVKTQEYHPR